MKVFASKRSGSYSGGLIIVAANSKYEAAGVLTLDKDKSIYTDEYKEWYELPNLTADVEEPQVIDEGGYTE